MAEKKITKEEKVEVTHPTVTTPIRERVLRRPGKTPRIFSMLANQFPNLKRKLVQAEMPMEPAEFVQKAVVNGALIYTLLIGVCLGMIFYTFQINLLYLLAVLPAMFLVFFWMWMLLPDAKMVSRSKKIDEEIVFAGRHLVIALRGGITLFDALVSVSKDYGEVSKEFRKVVERITLGQSTTQAIREVVAQCPSQYFNRVQLQLVNAIISGSDVASSLDAVLDQIATEQTIKMKEYGQRLNPLSMFFMLFGIVFPSLGVVFLTVVLSFAGGVGGTLGNILLPVVFAVLVAIQFVFVITIESGRPKFMI